MVQRVFVVRWMATPTVPELHALFEEMLAARRRTPGAMVAMIVIPEAVGVPPADVRALMQNKTPALLEQFDALYSVVEGRGIGGTLLRTALRAMSMAMARGGRRPTIAANTAEAIAGAASVVNIPLTTLHAELREKGLLES